MLLKPLHIHFYGLIAKHIDIVQYLRNNSIRYVGVISTVYRGRCKIKKNLPDSSESVYCFVSSVGKYSVMCTRGAPFGSSNYFSSWYLKISNVSHHTKSSKKSYSGSILVWKPPQINKTNHENQIWKKIWEQKAEQIAYESSAIDLSHFICHQNTKKNYHQFHLTIHRVNQK